MLKTLDKYIDSSTIAGRSRNRRFARLLVLSAIGHVLFYAWLINLDMSSDRWQAARSAPQTELVKITEIAPPPDRPSLRSAPEPVEQADLNRMEYDPDRADDVHLRSRSQKLGSADMDISSARKPSEAARHQTTAPAPAAPARVERVSPPPGVVISQLPSPQAAPPAPASIQIGAAPSNTAPAPARPAARAEATSGTTELGLEYIQAQYLAQVRAKIRKANDRIMPRKWVEDMLNGKVSADFELSLGRGGRILSVRLDRSTGYSQLDAIARQAIYMASPFEGYPQQAGESIICTVTVHYDRKW